MWDRTVAYVTRVETVHENVWYNEQLRVAVELRLLCIMRLEASDHPKFSSETAIGWLAGWERKTRCQQATYCAINYFCNLFLWFRMPIQLISLLAYNVVSDTWQAVELIGLHKKDTQFSSPYSKMHSYYFAGVPQPAKHTCSQGCIHSGWHVGIPSKITAIDWRATTETALGSFPRAYGPNTDNIIPRRRLYSFQKA